MVIWRTVIFSLTVAVDDLTVDDQDLELRRAAARRTALKMAIVAVGFFLAYVTMAMFAR